MNNLTHTKMKNENVASVEFKIEIEKISAVYSGKPGCMCGCRGKYTYLKLNQQWSSKYRGYKVGDEEVNDTVVKQFVSKIEKLISSGDIYEVDFNGDYLYLHNENDRAYCIYFVR